MSVTNNKNLLFFNKDGNPYNFELNSNNTYEGKLIFDENSSDTFKTLGIYVFEEVSPFKVTDNFTLNKMEIYNNSGISFQPFTYSGDTITNIARVNTASNFYSKWIHGENFDTKYPIGTVVSFHNTNFINPITNTPYTTTDFNNEYYTILDNKPNAILVNTKTSNNLWKWNFVTGNTSTIQSHNIVSLNDYDNTLNTKIKNWTLHNNKKFSIIGSSLNDGINIFNNYVSGNTIYQTFDITGNTGDVLKFNFELKTERPKLYIGAVDFDLSGNTAYLTFERTLNSNINLGVGQSIIFEDYNDNPILPINPIFTILDGTQELDVYDGNVEFIEELNINKTFLKHFEDKSLSSQYFVKNTTPTQLKNNTNIYLSQYPKNFFAYDNFIQISGSTDSFTNILIVGDIVKMSSTTHTTSQTNINRQFTILDIETFKKIRTEFWKVEISTNTSWYNTVKQKSIDNNRTLEEQIELDALWMYDNQDNNIANPKFIPLTSRVERLRVKEYVISETVLNNYNIIKLLTAKEIKTIKCSTTNNTVQKFTKNVVAYDTSNILSFSQEILSTYDNTINSFNTLYGDYLYNNYGILVYLTPSSTTLNIHSVYSLNGDYDKYFIPSLYKNNILLNTGVTNSTINRCLLEFNNQLYLERINPNNFSSFDINYSSEILFNLENNEINFGFNLELNDHDYYITFDTDTQTTINNFISKYSSTFNNMLLVLTSGYSNGYTLKIDALYSDVDVYSIKPKVNIFSSFSILNETKNKSLILAGNEIELSPNYNKSLYDYEFSTGMIFTLSGSQYMQNNVSYNIIGLTDTILELSYQGQYIQESGNYTLDVNRYLRKPRESINKNIYYNWKFVENNDGKFSNDIFFYDVTGEHLTPYLNDPKLTYIGTKPLWNTTNVCSNENIQLIDSPNKKLEYVSDPTKQQTMFKGTDGETCLSFLLDKYNSTSEYNYIPEPLQIFLGFNSTTEGVSQTNIVLEKVEYITFSGFTNSSTNPNNININFLSNGELEFITLDNNFNFIDYGFEKNQPITIDFVDQSNTGSTIFQNYGTMIIEYVGGNKLKVVDNTFIPFSTTGNSNGYYYEIIVQPNPILQLSVFGETETEDERFRIVLNNLGIQINEDVEQIFKDSDINEDGIDYIRLNQKRKEMLTVYPEIYNYIGSYKSLINTINFFGWNDLQLFEYYKNIDVNSPLYQKLQKVLIPDIFDNTIQGWSKIDYVEGKYKTGLVKKTNLFNLTYQITDEDGNNISVYSLDEVQTKLNKLKRWLKRNILPLSTNIMDITGVANVNLNTYQHYDVSNQVIKLHSSSDSTVVNFVYTETLNFKDNYLFEIEFYTRSGFCPSGWTCKIKTFSLSTDGTNKLIPQKYIKLMKNDLSNYSFNIDKNIDKFLYIETTAYNDFGLAQTYNKMVNTSISKNYILVNNRFHVPDYNYLNVDEQYYFFDEQGYIYLKN